MANELTTEEISLENLGDPNYVAPIEPNAEEVARIAAETEAARIAAEAEAERLKALESNSNPDATFFNKEGDQVDATGKVIKTKAEIEAASVEEEEIEIPELYNNKGDLVDLQGNVLKTKEQLDSNIEEDDSAIDIILKTYNLKPVDENNQPIVLEDTLDDFQKAVNLVVTQELAKQREAESQTFFETLPADVKQYYLHRKNDGKPEEFFTNISFDVRNVVLKEEDTDQLKEIIKRGQVARGYSLTDAERAIKKSEAVNELLEDAKIELDFMQAQVVKTEQAEAQAIKQRQLQEKQQAETLINTIKSTIASKNIGGLKVVDTDVTPFTDFMLRRGNEQMTAYEKALSNLTQEQELKLAYYIYKGYDISKLVQEKTNEKIVLNLKKRAEERSKGNFTPLPKGEITNDMISLDNLGT